MSDEATQQEFALYNRMASQGGISPTGEPELAQRDLKTYGELIDSCYDGIEQLKDNEDNKVFNEDGSPVIVRALKYKDVKILITSLSHLEGTSNYNWEQSMTVWIDWLELEFEPIVSNYIRDPFALTLLYRIRGIRQRQVFGDSQEGSRAGFIVKLSGGDKSLRLMKGDEGAKKKGLFGWS